MKQYLRLSLAILLVLAGAAVAQLSPVSLMDLTWEELAGAYDAPDVAVSKDNGVSEIYVGHPVTYIITVDNVGTAAAADVQVSDVIPVGLVDCSWTCGGGAPCSPFSGTGDVSTVISSVAIGGSVGITLTCQVSAAASGSLTNTAQVSAIGDSNAANDTADDVDSVGSIDFGDAPEPPYATTLAQDGARHLILDGFYLGGSVDAEADGQPDVDALGDDPAGPFDDEDGVTFLTIFSAGQVLEIEVVVSQPGYLSAWIDIEGDGSWAEPGDKVLSDQPVAAGINMLAIPIPSNATPADVVARFRLTANDNGDTLSYFGSASSGEVEDYVVTGALLFGAGFEGGNLGEWSLSVP